MGNASRAEEFQKRSTCKRLFLGFLKLMKLEGTWDSVDVNGNNGTNGTVAFKVSGDDFIEWHFYNL